MNTHFIKLQDFKEFVSKMIASETVIAPQAKRTRFVYGPLEDFSDLRLDFDVTILPPKKEFFPTNQELVTFDGDKYEGCIAPQKKILFGVHFYDIKAIDMTDLLFSENNKDWNYLANRQAATIVGCNIQSVFKRAFWGTAGAHVKAKGQDALLTKVDGGYVYEVITDKGRELLRYGTFNQATTDQIAAAARADAEMMDTCPEKLTGNLMEIPARVRAAFDKDEFWASCAEDCFSCGSCNIVCPTCYCFDVQDNWNLDQTSGVRTRHWDACLTTEFAEVSLGQGATENFRETRGARFRHRIMRKAAYLTEKLGGPACVGCGRCSSSCTADIADPVNVITKIMEG